MLHKSWVSSGEPTKKIKCTWERFVAESLHCCLMLVQVIEGYRNSLSLYGDGQGWGSPALFDESVE